MISIHHLGLSQSERIVWLCEELGLAYDLVRYERDPETRAAPASYKALHPAGTAPIIDDGGVVLAETGAIIDYLCRRHGKGTLLPGPEDPDLAAFLFWYHYANGSMMPAIMMDLVGKRYGAPAGTGRSTVAYALAESRLRESEWFAGAAFSAADIMMVFPLSTMRAYSGKDLDDMPATRAYLQRVSERPAFRAAMAKAEPDRAPGLV